MNPMMILYLRMIDFMLYVAETTNEKYKIYHVCEQLTELAHSHNRIADTINGNDEFVGIYYEMADVAFTMADHTAWFNDFCNPLLLIDCEYIPLFNGNSDLIKKFYRS